VWSEPRMVAKLSLGRDSRASKPRSAEFAVTVLKALVRYACLRSKVTINVAEQIPQLYRNGSRAEIVWTDEALQKFRGASRDSIWRISMMDFGWQRSLDCAAQTWTCLFGTRSARARLKIGCQS
jgi:hypothetical protein